MFFLISDYPNFDSGDFSTLRFAAFEIWNQSDRAKNFRQLLIDYYKKIYIPHIEQNPKATPAPKNFWPYSYQFYLCNPIKTFECIVHDAYSNPEIEIRHYTKPDADRSFLESEPLPINLLHADERLILTQNGYDLSNITEIDEEGKGLLPLRNTSEAHTQTFIYYRQ